MPDVETSQEVIEPEQEVTEENVEAVSTEEEIVPKEVSVDDIVAEAPSKAKKGGVQARIDELTKKRYEAERRAELLEEQLKKVSDTPVVTSNRPIPPVEGEFVDTEDFRKARMKYEDDLDAWKDATRKASDTQTREQEALKENFEKYESNATRMREKYSDYDQVVGQPIFSPNVISEIYASEWGPEIGYFLAKNPSEALKLSKLPLNVVAKEIGKLEVKFSQAKSKIISSAPDPIKPIQGDDVVKKDPSKMSMDEWVKWDRQRTVDKLKTQGVL